MSEALGVLAVSESAANVTTLGASLSNRTRHTLRAGRVTLLHWKSLLSKAAVSPGGDVLLCEAAKWNESHIIVGSDYEGRFGSTLSFSKPSNRSIAGFDVPFASLLVGSSIAGYGAGKVSAHDVSVLSAGPVKRILSSRRWALSGKDIHESKGRLGASTLVLADRVIVGAPMADNSGTAPDGDQMGAIYSIHI